jgi:pyridoxamine 5'-phosphate oxidase
VTELLERDVDPNPIRQFDRWYDEARALPVAAPDAMTLATATPEGVPSARMVLLKGFDERGVVFYSNYDSQKGRELVLNPRAALVLYWPELHRQVRISGSVTRTTREESEHYFHSRPFGSQISAAASRQSAVIANRTELDERVAALETELIGKSIPLPPDWGGYRLAPESIEFWQGRPNRLHDRLRYTRLPSGTWKIERLSP